jgi:DNA replication protein DnaC
MHLPCPECGTEEQRARKRRLWARRGIPERLREATLEEFQTPTQAHIDAVTHTGMMVRMRSPLFLLLLGDNGNGKSHLGAAALRSRGEGLFITHKSLIDEIRASYGSKTMTSADVIEKYQETPFLALDELGASTGGADEQPQLCDILCKRHDKRFPTIITSNHSLPEIKDILGFRVMDRIAEDYKCCVLRGQSFRSKP